MSEEGPPIDDLGSSQDGSAFVHLREQDRFLPIANISRIMKKSLPKDAKIAKDAKETVQECVSEFISFITSEASEKCLQEKRKTINGEDLLYAMQTLGFDAYHEPLKCYLAKYREHNDKSQGAKVNRSPINKKDENSPISREMQAIYGPITPGQVNSYPIILYTYYYHLNSF